jgi:hypothetical protein
MKLLEVLFIMVRDTGGGKRALHWFRFGLVTWRSAYVLMLMFMSMALRRGCQDGSVHSQKGLKVPWENYLNIRNAVQ